MSISSQTHIHKDTWIYTTKTHTYLNYKTKKNNIRYLLALENKTSYLPDLERKQKCYLLALENKTIILPEFESETVILENKTTNLPTCVRKQNNNFTWIRKQSS